MTDERNLQDNSPSQPQESLRLTFQVTEEEVYDGLCKMDKLQGSSNKQKAVFGLLMAIAALDFFQFITEKNGIALLLSLAFILLAYFYKRRSVVANRKLAAAFAADPQQLLDAQYTQLQLTDRATSYQDIQVLYEFAESFGLRYMGSYYFVVPKRVFSPEQLEAFRALLKAELGERYDDRSATM